MLSSLKLTSQTPLGQEEKKKLNIIIQSLMDNSDSSQFRTPVDWKGLGLTDYPLIVKHPMDLGTLRKKLLNNEYAYVEMFLDDMQLIWDNCCRYNQESCWYHITAKKFDSAYKKMVRNYMPEIPMPPEQHVAEKHDNKKHIQEFSEPQDVSYKQKLNFSHRLKNLSHKDLGALMEKVHKKCPEAFRELENDRAELIVDNLPKDIFEAIQEEMEDLLEGQGRKRKH